MATWARGVDFKNSTNTTRVGGIGIYGTDTTTNKLYIGLGAEPWNNAGLQLTSSAINFKGNKIYHAGDKPTASEIGAAAASHSHNYLPLSGGAVTSSNFGPLVIKRSGSTNASTIVFSNDNGTLGSIGMTASKNGGLIRWTDDTASSYTILDTGNYKSFVTPTSIGAAAASHNHNVLISAGGRIESADIAAKGDRGLRMYLATKSMTTGKPASDGFILNFDWDTTAGWSSQMYIKNSNSPIMQIRGMNAGTWGSWYTLYSTNNKPTPAEIGAAASSHTHSYIPLSGSTGVTGTLRSNSEIQTTSQNAFRAVSGNYGFFIRNDGSNTYFLLTNSGDQYGNWNSLRPLSINNSTGVVTFGNGLKGTLDGNASTATTLQNARTINDVNFNGSSNITIPLKTFVSNVGNDNTKNYHRILSSGVVTGSYADKTIILMGSGNYSGGPFGIVKIILRTNASGSNSNCNIDWMVRKGFGLDSIVCNMINTYGSTVADIFYKCAGAYAAINWTVLFENNGRGGSYNNGSWTKYSTNASGTEVYTETEMKALRSYTSTLAQGSDTTVVNSANKLASGRTLTIGSKGKSFDGTSNVSWSLSEIGAASSSHTHNYAAAKSAGGGALEVIPVQDTANKVYLTGILDFNSAKIRASTPYMAGGTITATTFVGALNGNATTATTLATARTINGTSFNGSANITTANWGTARTITIGSTGKSVNGSGNVSWSLSEIGAAAASHSHSYLPLSGGTLTGRLTANGKISLPTTGSTWLSGKTLTNASIAITTKQTTVSYHPVLAVQSSSDHVVNIGGLGDNFGFYGYKSTRTDNGTDWSFTFNASNGAVSSSGNITAPVFAGNLQGNATTATTATKVANSLILNVGGFPTSFNGQSRVEVHVAPNVHNHGSDIINQMTGYVKGKTSSAITTSDTLNSAIGKLENKVDSKANSNHTHNYLPLTGGTLTGDLKIAKSNAQLTLNGKDTNYYQIAHSSANGTLVFNYNGKSLFTVQNNGNIIPTTNKDMSIGDFNFKLKSIASEDFSTSAAKIITTSQPNTIQVQGLKDSGMGAIKLGTGGCRIYGTSSAERLYVEGGIYTNLSIECGDQIIANGAVYPGRNAQGGWDCGLANRRFYTVYCVNVNQSSDRSMKEDINYIDNEIELLSSESKNPTPFKDFICNDLKVATYKYKRQITTENEDGTSKVEDIEHEPQDSQIGFIAQDIRNTEVGSMFVYGEDGNMNYSPSGFTTVVAKALQEEIKYRDQEIAQLKEELSLIKEKLGL